MIYWGSCRGAGGSGGWLVPCVPCNEQGGVAVTYSDKKYCVRLLLAYGCEKGRWGWRSGVGEGGRRRRALFLVFVCVCSLLLYDLGPDGERDVVQLLITADF